MGFLGYQKGEIREYNDKRCCGLWFIIIGVVIIVSAIFGGEQKIHPIIEHSWGQRVVRFYDPDKHIIEVGENMKIVCKRFLNSGMTPEQVAKRMDVPMKFINACMR